jgi:hypothetical protein
VGYVNVTIPSGIYSLIANPLSLTASNNDLNAVLSLPDDQIGTTIVFWSNTAQGFDADTPIWAGSAAGWVGGQATYTVSPGQAFFILPSSASSAPSVSITFVGDVPQGTLNTPLSGANKYSFVASQVPQQASVDDLGLPASPGDSILLFSNGGYGDAIINGGPGVWVDGGGNLGPGPTIAPSQGFAFLQASGVDTTAWTRTFSVN